MLKLTAKLLLLAGAVTVGQICICPKPRQPDIMVTRMDAYLAEHPSVYYFCDSSNASLDPQDTDTRSIADFTENMLQGHERVVAMDHPAYYAEMYLKFYEYLLENEDKQGRHKALVVPINIRSFALSWDLCPPFQFESTKAYLRVRGNSFLEAFHRPMETFEVLMNRPLTMKEYEASYCYDGDQYIGRMGDYLSSYSGRAKIGYHCRIKENQRNMVALRRISELSKKHNDVVVFYLLPVNYHFGVFVSGEEFNQHVAENAELVKQALADHDPPPIDLIFSLPKDVFTRGTWDHTNSAGRRFVASFVAEALSRELNVPLDRHDVLASRQAIQAPGDALEDAPVHVAAGDKGRKF